MLLLGDHRQSLAVARSLGAAGYWVIAGRPAGQPTILEQSRFVDEVWSHPPRATPRAWAEALEAFCAWREDVGVVFPIGDDEIELARPLADRLPALVAVVPARAAAVCRSKAALLAFATDTGVPTEPWEPVAAPDALEPALRRLGAPAVLKPDVVPLEATLGFKAKIVSTLADAPQLARETIFPAGGFVLQRAARGTRHNLYFAASAGRLLGYAQVRVVRTDRPDGTGLAVEGITVEPLAPLVAWTKALVSGLSYTGAGCAQFVVDEMGGATSFLEINARLGANVAAVCACGFDLPRLFVESLLGVAEEPRPAKIGRRYAWLSGDLAGIHHCLSSGCLTWAGAARWLARTALCQLRARNHVTWSWRDPLPTLTMLGRWLRAMVRASWRRLRR